MIRWGLKNELTQGEKAEKQKAKGLALEETWFWKMRCESEKENSEKREGMALEILK